MRAWSFHVKHRVVPRRRRRLPASLNVYNKYKDCNAKSISLQQWVKSSQRTIITVNGVNAVIVTESMAPTISGITVGPEMW